MRTDRAAVDRSVVHRALASKAEEPLTEKQARFVEAYTTQPTATLQAVAKQAGYQGRSLKARPYVELRKPKIRKAIATAFRKLGMTPQYWAWRLKEASEATQLVWTGKTRETVPDYKARLAATRMALELRGAFDAPVAAGPEAGSSITLHLGFKSSWQPSAGRAEGRPEEPGRP